MHSFYAAYRVDLDLEEIGTRSEGNNFSYLSAKAQTLRLEELWHEEEVCGIGMEVWAMESEKNGFKSSSTIYFWYNLVLMSEIHWFSIPFVKRE